MAQYCEALVTTSPEVTTNLNELDRSNKDADIPRLEDFHISEKTGFLLEEPLTELPEYFEPWNVIGRQIPALLSAHKLRDVVDEMSLLDHRLLANHRQWRLAYTILSFIGAGYVWQDGETQTIKKVPRQLAVPWHGVSSHLGLKPAVCQANAVLSNWRIVDSSRPVTLENMRLICELPGDINCQWFFLVSAAIEKSIVPGLQAILKAKKSIVAGNTDAVRQSLDALADNIDSIRSILKRTHENLDADVFYNVLRPYFSGWGGDSTIIPDGLLFEGVSSAPISVIGSSAAQSSSIQCFDAALGVVHDPDKQQFLDVMKTYMPPVHARFIDKLREAPSIRAFVYTCKDQQVVEAYKRCIKALCDFRSYHIQITTKYVVSKSRAARGTGGTELTPFLKGIRSTTSLAAAALDR